MVICERLVAGTANNYSGVLAGGGGGYNYQMGALVIGGQVEWDWTNARGGESFSGGNSFSCPINTVVLNVPSHSPSIIIS